MDYTQREGGQRTSPECGKVDFFWPACKGLDTSVPRDGVRRCRCLEILDKLHLPSEIAKGRMLEREYLVESDASVKD